MPKKFVVYKYDETGKKWKEGEFASRMLADNYIQLMRMKIGPVEADKLRIEETND